MPRRLAYVWSAFELLTWGLKSDGMGPVMASWADVDAFCQSQRLPFDPHEKALLVKLCTMRASIQAKQQAEKAKADAAQGSHRSG